MRNEIAEKIRETDTPEAWERVRLLAIGEIQRLEARHAELKHYAMLLQQSVSERMPALERRIDDLLDANNRYLEEARQARRAERTVRLMLEVLEGRFNALLGKHDFVTESLNAAWAEVMAKEAGRERVVMVSPEDIYRAAERGDWRDALKGE